MKRQKSNSEFYKALKEICIAALVSGAAILFFGCENDLEKIKAFSSPENLPIVQATNFESTFTDSGQIRYSLKSSKLLRFKIDGVEYVEFPEGMEMVQYDAKKKVVSSLKADYAKQFIKEQKWEAKNNVVATNDVGDTLKTEHLIWEEEKERIHTEDYVEIVRPDGIYTGIGFTSDESMSNWRINKLKGITYVTVDENGSDDTNKREESVDMEKRMDRPFTGPLKLEN